MSTPIFPLTEMERAAIYGILKRYPAAFQRRWSLNWSVFGFKIRPSASVKGIVEDLVGPEPQ
jgi:hypothetical protein